MDLNEYQKLAMRTSAHLTYAPDKVSREMNLLDNAILGLCGETGELANLWKKHIFHGHSLETDQVIEELGDILWYISQACEAIGMNLEDVAVYNITKLRKRYPEGFSSERSRER